jgi:outer membrane lipopolysaccharide assembly protein LptE/RlpB
MMKITYRFSIVNTGKHTTWMARNTMRNGILVLALVCAFFFYGCGYTIQGKADLPFQTIAIDKIVNKTFEPKLEDRMQIALVNELMVEGFVMDSSSAYRINGAITQFELRTLSEKSGVATEYEVIIKGDFRLIDPSGKARELRNRGVFIVSFSSSEQLQTVMALKELATDRALKDLSSEIVASLMYQ